MIDKIKQLGPAIIVALIIGFVAGKLTEQHETKSVSQIDTKVETDKQKDTKIVETKVETKSPDGETKVVTTTETVISERKETVKDRTETKTETSSPTGNRVTLTGMAGYDFDKKLTVYGGGVSKEILGPVSIGVWGLSNGTAGVSLGLRF